MKNTLALAALVFVAGTAQAAGLSFRNTTTVTRTEAADPAPTFAALDFAIDTSLTIGELFADTAGTLTFTYLGQESGYLNGISFMSLNMDESATPGVSTLSGSVGAGSVAFDFFDSAGGTASNGGKTWLNSTSIGLIGNDLLIGSKRYDMVLGFNDSGGGGATSGDWDDYVVGVNLVTAVPEPSSYGLMVAGLIGMGLFARRRNPR
jgi:hypothetical protein